jgi:hypothetical protein
MSKFVTDNKQFLTMAALIAAMFGGGTAADWVPDGETLAKLGPVGIFLIAYVEVRIRPLLVRIATSLSDDATIAQAVEAAPVKQADVRKSGPVGVVRTHPRPGTNGR